jgi:REP element-mobilizing transposase RayT
MSNHIHFIIQSDDRKLSDLIRDFKKFTAKTILDNIKVEPESRRDWMLERYCSQSYCKCIECKFVY